MATGKYQEWLEPEGLLKLEGWARDGLTEEQIAHNIGVNRNTITQWKSRFPSISCALKKGKEVVDRQVENALLKRALGYTYEEVCEEYEGGVLTKRKVTKKEVVADTTAQIFWLKNRKPKEWRDKRAVTDREETEPDGFMDALKGQVQETFEKAGEIIET